MNKLNLQPRASQQIAMTPQLLQSIRLLQLSTLELEQELRQALETNVMLEGEDDDMSAIEVDAQANSAERQDVEVSGIDPCAERRGEADFDGSGRDSWDGGEASDGGKSGGSGRRVSGRFKKGERRSRKK